MTPRSSETPFALQLIAAEEQRVREVEVADPPRERPVSPVEPRPEQIVISRRDFTTTSAFNLHDPSTSLPLEGPGTLVDLLIISDSDQMDIFLSIDDRDIVQESFQSIQADSSDLSRLAAYERTDNKFVFSASDYEFQHQLSAGVVPNEETTFDRQRVEVDRVRDD